MIRKFSRIHINSFQNFSWEKKWEMDEETETDRKLPNLARYNLIYGWNGSGKTTISEVFRDAAGRPSKGNFELEMEGGESRSVEVLFEDNNKVFVFNSSKVGDFIKNVSHEGDGEKSVSLHIFGKENIQTYKNIQQKEDLQEQADEERKGWKKEKEDEERRLKFLRENEARRIKNTITQDYKISDKDWIWLNKGSYETEMLKRIGCENLESRADVLEKNENRARSELLDIVVGGAQYNREIKEVVWESVEAFSNLEEEVSQALALNPTHKAIDTLKENPEVNAWAEEGWRLHRKPLPSAPDWLEEIVDVDEETTCLFCENTITANRMEALRLHFSDEYDKAMIELRRVYSKVRDRIKLADELLRSGTLFLNENQINPEVRAGWASEAESVKGALAGYKEYLDRALKALTEKGKNPTRTPTNQLLDRVPVSFDSINELVKKHNQAVDKYEQTKKKKTDALVFCMIDSKISEYQSMQKQIDEYTQSEVQARGKIVKLQQKIDGLKGNLTSEKDAIDRLNRLIKQCFNYTSLCFTLIENGDRATYKLMRRNPEEDEPVEDNLSDGERSTIAFLYFLITLKGKDVSPKDSIIVIDDPVSNMDYSISASVCGLIIENAKDVKQLFVLTHRYDIFSQLKRNFREELEKVEREFYKKEKEEQKKREGEERQEQEREEQEEQEKDEQKKREREERQEQEKEEQKKKREGMKKKKEKEKEKNSYSCYLLERGEKGSAFAKLPEMLLKHDSEYGFLFHEVWKTTSEKDPLSTDDRAMRLYYVANMCRKLVETFLEFRAPHRQDLKARIDVVRKIVRQNSKVGEICLPKMYASVQELSHASPNFNSLTTAKSLCQDVMNFIKFADKEHYKYMNKICRKDKKKIPKLI